MVHLKNGEYGLVQMKLGGSEEEIDDAARKMEALADIVDEKREKKPAFMMVLVGVEKYAYKREDGVYVVPVGCLKP